MKPALLDVNVLIALVDAAHVSHEAAHVWFDSNRAYGWATCPITENGCLRIMTHSGYVLPGLAPETVCKILRELVSLEGHLFWRDSVSLLDEGRFELAGTGPKQLTDLYLVGLALKFGGKLVTFDRGIRWQAVTGCKPEHLEVI